MNRFRRSWLWWKPTHEYLKSPWRCYAEAVQLLRDRGARFITMREAVAGQYNEAEVNVLLDHHIDSGPIETEVMCRWEQSIGVRSSVYLFHRSTPCRSTVDGGPWELTDLNIETYRDLERAGFEIGYHSNAVGQARQELFGEARTTQPSEEILKRAADIFVGDVQGMRRFFTIDTFIPHGAGQGNHLLKDVPEACDDLVWVYNDAASARAGERRPSFKNWTDTAPRGLRHQVIGADCATYVVRHHNLHIGACLVKPGLNHFLVHANRFGHGMPYELYSRPDELHATPVESSDYASLERVPEPCTLNTLTPGSRSHYEDVVAPAVRSWIGRRESDDVDGVTVVLTNCPRTLGYALMSIRRPIGHIARQSPFDREALGLNRDRDTTRVRKPKAMDISIDMIDEVDPSTAFSSDDDSFRQYAPFYNEVYSMRLFQHLHGTPLRYDMIVLQGWQIHNRAELDAFLQFIDRCAREEILIDLAVHVTKFDQDACMRRFNELARPESQPRLPIHIDQHPQGGSRVRVLHVPALTSSRNSQPVGS